MLAFGTQASLAITPYDDVLVQQAVKNVQQENYDEALAQLTEAWQKGTHTPEKAFLFGQVYRLMLNYAKAKEYLQEALRLKRDFRPAQLMLADTLLAMDQPKEARPILQNLLASGYEPGQTAFLMGVAATKEGQYSEALDYFRKAEADPKVAQEAKFQASLALAALNRVKEAKTAMQESIALNPQSQTADFAKRYMGVLSQRVQEQRPFHITVSSAFDYDSNVTLAPGGGASVSTVSGKGSAVFSQTALLEYTILPSGPFSVLTQYSYFQNFHPAVQGYDIMSHFMGLTPTYGFKNGRFWLPMNYTYMDLQSDKYYTGFNGDPHVSPPAHPAASAWKWEPSIIANIIGPPSFLPRMTVPAMPGEAMWGCTTFSKSKRGLFRPAWAICTTTPPAATGIAPAIICSCRSSGPSPIS